MSDTHRVAWLDSARMPSHIHATDDNGETTVCGYTPLRTTRELVVVGQETRPRWLLTSEGPRKIQGRSNYCKRCFENRKKTSPWLGEM